MKVFDILLDDDFDLQIKNGDLVAGESTYQHVLLLLATEQGSWRKVPFAGANFSKNINTNNLNNSSVVADTKKALEIDGIRVLKLEIVPKGIAFEGEY
jgi:hypothetical protein